MEMYIWKVLNYISNRADINRKRDEPRTDPWGIP